MSSQFSPQEAYEFLQKMWNPLGLQVPGFPPPYPGAPSGPAAMPFPTAATMMAALDPAEVEKKIAEMRIVENWLSMMVSWVQMSIKTMELQKSSLEAFQAATGAAAGAAASFAASGVRSMAEPADEPPGGRREAPREQPGSEAPRQRPTRGGKRAPG